LGPSAECMHHGSHTHLSVQGGRLRLNASSGHREVGLDCGGAAHDGRDDLRCVEMGLGPLRWVRTRRVRHVKSHTRNRRRISVHQRRLHREP